MEWSKASRVKGPNTIRMVEERKKTMRHFYGTRVFNEMLLVQKNEKTKNLILGPVEPVPERCHSSCESVYKAAYKKYYPGLGMALEPIVNDSANAATNKPVV